jgi:hypothetical protein
VGFVEVGFQNQIYSASHQLAETEADSRRTIRASPGSKGSKAITGVTTGQRLAQLDTPNTEQQDCEQHNIRKRSKSTTAKAKETGELPEGGSPA